MDSATGFNSLDDKAVQELLDAVRSSNMMPQDIRVLVDEVERLRGVESVLNDIYKIWKAKRRIK